MSRQAQNKNEILEAWGGIKQKTITTKELEQFLGVTETSTKLNTFMTNSLKKCIAICACVKIDLAFSIVLNALLHNKHMVKKWTGLCVTNE
ncbi:hypothetical protein [Flagellimonas beolgyonensis]|uniref:hypothetical protein n=1 Tax=Flagellimonas beolgyonensis TaxID=864064 RepID=UPI000F8E9896|nr:hypothetical protein [Allomuricauda beolgyonensis]